MLSDKEVRRRIEVTREVLAGGGTIPEAADRLGLKYSRLYAFLRSRNELGYDPAPKQCNLDYDEIFRTHRPDETAYAIAKRTGRDPKDVKVAALSRGVTLAPGSNGARGFDWDTILAKAEEEGLTQAQVAKMLGCQAASVAAAAAARGIRLRPGRAKLESIDWDAILAKALEDGLSKDQVAEQMGCSVVSVWRAASARGIQLRRKKKSNMRAGIAVGTVLTPDEHAAWKADGRRLNQLVRIALGLG